MLAAEGILVEHHRVPFEDTGLGHPFLAEFATGAFAAAPAGIDCHLVIQSEADETVSSDHGTTLHAQASDPRGLLMIPAADHRITDPSHRRHAIARTVEWLQQYL